MPDIPDLLKGVFMTIHLQHITFCLELSMTRTQRKQGSITTMRAINFSLRQHSDFVKNESVRYIAFRLDQTSIMVCLQIKECNALSVCLC